MHDLDPKDYFKQDSEIQLFHHPSLSAVSSEVSKNLQSLSLNNHLAIFSSGTSSSTLKGYVLSHHALKVNAEAVNNFYQITAQDIWALSLPDYHVGGLSVLMRAMLTGSKVVDCRKWDPVLWVEKLNQRKVTITTVVPTQIYDLVKFKLRPPSLLRLLIVGGDFLSTELEGMARSLGWPVVRTYGMTEVGSQLASATLNSSQLQILPIHQVKVSAEEQFFVKGPSLFSWQFQLSKEWIIKSAPELCDEQGFYLTQDWARLSGKFLIPLGRWDEKLKIAGHMVDVPGLKEILYTCLLQTGFYGSAEISIEDNDRKGKKLVLLHLAILPGQVLEMIKESLLPVRVDEVRSVSVFDRTDLGKLKKVKS